MGVPQHIFWGNFADLFGATNWGALPLPIKYINGDKHCYITWGGSSTPLGVQTDISVFVGHPSLYFPPLGNGGHQLIGGENTILRGQKN